MASTRAQVGGDGADEAPNGMGLGSRAIYPYLPWRQMRHAHFFWAGGRGKNKKFNSKL